LEIGICLPYMKEGLDRETLLGWARAIDAGPFASLSCGERITGGTVEMRAVLAAAAAVTERVRIVPSLYVLPMHNAVWAAKEIATLDVLSGGRAAVTVGVGGREADYRAVGASFARRHARMDEQVGEMRRIWRGEPPFEGADVVGPPPVQIGGPPIYAGVMGPKAMRRAGRWADGVYVWSGNGEKAEIASLLQRADEAWSEAARPSGPRRIGGFWYCLAPEESQSKLARYVHDYLAIFGEAPARAMAERMNRSDPGAVRAAIDDMEAVGCEELFLVPATAELAEVERLAEIVAARG
jgi:alkanesulfonate monooxygenase SsuD/methylene tetrahydromethanopterin reductase-like flavin-dependent oxidoreductase (luciferase family)